MSKYLDINGFATFWNKLKEKINLDGGGKLSDNNYTNSDKEKLDGIESGANKYTLPTASDTILGGVKIDNNTITINSDGVISSAGSDNATTPITFGKLDGATLGDKATCEGIDNSASGLASHAEGYYNEANGDYSHAEGDECSANGENSHAEGSCTTAEGINSHAEGDSNYANGDYSHAEGCINKANGYCSHAEGGACEANGNYSHAEGDYTIANGYCTHSQGTYNSDSSSNTYSSENNAFIIGNGSSDSLRANAFRVKFDGTVYGGTYNSTGADYAEYFEWLDGNLNNEDRVGYFVTLEGDKIRKANSSDDYIIGIISSTMGVVGDSYEDNWKGMYKTDYFGRTQYAWQDITREERYYEIIDGKRVRKTKEITVSEYRQIMNEDYDNTKEYIPRSKRKEFSCVGRMGKLYVRDDGTCVVNGYCKCNDDGVATYSNEKTSYRVMERITDNIIRVNI